MIASIRRLLDAEPETLAREALGLASLVAAILAAFCLPGLA